MRDPRARPAIPAAAAGAGRESPLLQKLIGTVVTLLVLVWIISSPASAGDAVHHWITGIITFFVHLS
jgi:hypothetical protein